MMLLFTKFFTKPFFSVHFRAAARNKLNYPSLLLLLERFHRAQAGDCVETQKNAEKCMAWSTEIYGAHNANGRRHAPDLATKASQLIEFYCLYFDCV